jgi:hypothetical protein
LDISLPVGDGTLGPSGHLLEDGSVLQGSGAGSRAADEGAISSPFLLCTDFFISMLNFLDA